jgi:hypothetical protein
MRSSATWPCGPGTPWSQPGPTGFALHFEPLLRVHLAAAGTRQDLLHALEDASSLAEEIHRQGREVATEFVEGRHHRPLGHPHPRRGRTVDRPRPSRLVEPPQAGSRWPLAFLLDRWVGGTVLNPAEPSGG